MAMKTLSTPLLPQARPTSGKHRWNCINARFCIRSKAALLTLLWSFPVTLLLRELTDVNATMQVGTKFVAPVVLTGFAIFIAILAPVTGLLTDVRFSRHKTVLITSYAIIVQVLLILMLEVTGLLLAHYRVVHNFAGDKLIGKLLLYGAMLFVSAGCAVYAITVFQFGMDQLHDSPTEDLVLFIHWNVWISYACSFLAETVWNLMYYNLRVYSFSLTHFSVSGFVLVNASLILTLLLLIISLCIMRHRKVWFLLEPAGVNPYKLVYRVTRFACRHKVPLRRSAFTYCTEELPTRMDVGKSKYGGPFTTKQVEEVKAFWGILKVLISTGSAFFTPNRDPDNLACVYKA